MDLIAATMAKKRSALEDASGKKKYIRRGDIEKEREKRYLEEQAEEREKERQRILAKELEEEEELRKRKLATSSKGSPFSSGVSSPASTSTPELSGKPEGAVDSDTETLNNAAAFNIAPEEVVRRLRARGHPIRLFAETDQQRKIRLRALELVEDRSEGQRNDFMRALENAETGLHMEALGRQKDGDESTKGGKDKKKQKVDPTKDLDTSEISTELLRKDQDKIYVLIYTYYKRLLREWENDLNDRPDEIKRSTQGKLATATQAQSAEYLRPFFKSLRQKALEPDVLMRITEISQLMIKREYMTAKDAYLRLSIGNAPWPIGVTMVGIHERSGREKIFSAQVAHVLNDETSRKWIQSIKRIMTFVENKYPR